MKYKKWLETFIVQQGGTAGSVHHRMGEVLTLSASINLPPEVIEKTRVIAKGEGMAGLAWERNRTVTTCDLQSESRPEVRSTAKVAGARGAFAIPMHDERGELCAVVSIAFEDGRDVSEPGLRALEHAAREHWRTLAEDPSMTREIERITDPDPAAIAERLEYDAQPLVIAGAVRHWPAFARWSPTYVGQKIGDIEIKYAVSTSNAHPDFRQITPSLMFASERATLTEYLHMIGSGPDAERARFLFVGDDQRLLERRGGVTTINPKLAVLLDDIEVPSYFPEPRLYSMWTWFSGPGVRTWLHYDNNGCHNLNAQITGSKRCTLFPPESLAHLHPYLLGGDNPAHNCCAIDVECPDARFASDLHAVPRLEAELQAGDLLFIPACWFHTFVHLGEFNSNVNFWWKPTRPRWNVVMARQALVDAAADAKLDSSDANVAAVLRALDAAFLRSTDL